jgi:hypothetical protein
MSIEEDELEERRRQAEERKKMRRVDLVYDTAPKITKTGMMHGHSAKRAGRMFGTLFRMTLTTRAVFLALKARDNIPTDPVFFELMLEAYMEKYREPPIVIPSEEELIEKYLAQRDDDDE